VAARSFIYNNNMYTSLKAINDDIIICKNCGLHETRKNTVFGEGSPSAAIMLIGEGPGRDEDELGRPFVGKAGQLLDKMLASIGLTRNDVYIANILKCRPPGNRDPLPHEAAACIGYLRAQVALIRPNIIVCLGRISANYILGREVRISRDRGVWHESKGFYIMPTYHPAALLRNEKLKKESYADLLSIKAKYDELLKKE
jgi:uracil-DNA glycosylase family 4